MWASLQEKIPQVSKLRFSVLMIRNVEELRLFSFAEVVKGLPISSGNHVVVGDEVVQANEEWLTRSWRGRVEWVGAIPSIVPFCESIVLEGIIWPGRGSMKCCYHLWITEKAIQALLRFQI